VLYLARQQADQLTDNAHCTRGRLPGSFRPGHRRVFHARECRGCGLGSLDRFRRMTPNRILVVDDEPQMRRAFRVVLRANGYVITEVASGAAALDAAA
jgi:hypothetical protein